MVDQYNAEKHLSVKVVYNTGRGYHLNIPVTIIPEADLPDGFIQGVRNSKNIACTTEEILSLYDRAN